MATVKIITWSRPDKNGQYPIGFKISHQGKPTYIFEGHTLPDRNLWDAKKQEIRKSHPHAARLTNLLLKRLLELRGKALDLETDQQAVAVSEIKVAYQSIRKPSPEKTTFKEIAERYLEEQRLCGNFEVYNTERGHLKRFYTFVSGKPLIFSDITVGLLQQYYVFLKQEKKFRYNMEAPAKPLSQRTITNHLICIRTIYNRAIAYGVASKDSYPFGAKGKIAIKLPPSSKIGLSEAEIRNMEMLDLSQHSSIYRDARNIWLTEFYFAGMRVTDCLLLKWTDLQDGRLYYQMSKNGEHGSVKIPVKAYAILEQYRKPAVSANYNTHGLIFPFLQAMPTLDDRFALRRKIAQIDKRLNKAMAKIMELIGSTKNASQHKARHSFAQRAEEKEIHPKVLQKMYRHESILTTMQYQSNFSFEKADSAIEAVVEF